MGERESVVLPLVLRLKQGYRRQCEADGGEKEGQAFH
jgi:hypothetical protein